MRALTWFVALLLVTACSKKSEKTPEVGKPITEEKAAPPAPAVPAPAAPAPAAPAVDNGAMTELYPYGEGEAYKRFKPAAGETLFDSTPTKVVAWHPGAGNGGAGDAQIDVAVVTKDGKVGLILQPDQGTRTTLPLGLDPGNLEVTGTMFEERGEHRLMVRVSEITMGATEGEIETYLLAWDAAKKAPVAVEHWKGLVSSESLPAWAMPADE